MVQYVKQGNIFGRIGTGIGKGLSEQLPKEIDRGRLASGLKNFESEHQNLTPIQQLSRLSAIPGITPQMIQSFSDLAKIQNQGNAFQRASGNVPGQGGPGPMQMEDGINRSSGVGQVPSGGMTQNGRVTSTGAFDNKQRTPNIGRNEDTPVVTEGNPLNKQNLPRTPWTPQERNSTISGYINQGFLPDQAKQLAADDEARFLGQPEVYKERQAQIKSAKTEARDALKRHLETKLQKSGENVFKDVEGPMIVNAERGMIRDLIENPKADIDNIANDWSDRLYRTAVAKGRLNTLLNTSGIESLFKGNQTENKLKEYQDIFKRSDNLEEYYNILKKNGLSSQGSASVAFPPGKNISNYISKHASSTIPSEQKARKAALDIQNLGIGPNDSILSIARGLSQRDPFFDQQSFFDQMSEDKDKIGLNERQRLELAEGARDILPNWADLLYLPMFRR